jgi:hypothetical protein
MIFFTKPQAKRLKYLRPDEPDQSRRQNFPMIVATCHRARNHDQAQQKLFNEKLIMSAFERRTKKKTRQPKLPRWLRTMI